MASELDRIIREHRERLAASETSAVSEIIAAYEDLRLTLERQLRDLEAAIANARAADKKISPSWLYRERRLKTLLEAVERELQRFGARAAAIIERRQREAVSIAVSSTQQLLVTIGQTNAVSTLLPTRAIETVIGMLGDGSPLIDYFSETLAPDIVKRIRKILIEGVSTGKNARTVARELYMTGDITRNRAMTTARTELGRANREAARQIYLSNSDIITGWEWVASKSPRTCPACLSLDGSVYELSVPFPQHYNCRCTIIPVLVGVTRQSRTLGRDWLANQPQTVVEQVLGKAGADLYSRGEVTLSDFVGWATDKRFGKRVYTKTLAAIIVGQH